MKFLPYIILFFSLGLQGQSVDYYVKLVPCEKNKAYEEVEKTNPRIPPRNRSKTRSQPQPFDVSGYLSKSTHDFTLKCLSSMDKVSRIKLVKEEEGSNFPITHVLETCALINITEQGTYVKEYVDSTKTVIAGLSMVMKGVVDIRLVDIATGKIIVSKKVEANQREETSESYSYASFNKKGTRPKGSEVERKARKASNNLLKQTVGSLKNTVRDQGEELEYHLFPYRLKVLEASVINGDRAKKLKVEYDSKYGNLNRKRGAIFYEANENVEGKNRLVSKKLSTGFVESCNRETGTFIYEVSFKNSEQQILKALNEGKELFFAIGSINSNTDKPQKKKIAVGKITAPSYFDPSIKGIYSNICAKLIERGDLDVLERKGFDQILEIKDDNKSDAFIGSITIKQFSSVGADYLMEIVFDEPKTSRIPSFSSQKVRQNLINYSYQFKLFDVKTGELIMEEQETSSITSKGFYSLNIAAKKALGVQYEVKEFLDFALPRKLEIQSVLLEKNGKAQVLELNGIFKVEKNEKFLVMEVIEKEVNGELLIRHKEIGKIKLKERINDFQIKASVKKGGKEILEAIQEGKKLFFTAQPNWIDRWDNRVEERLRRKGQ